MPDPAGIEPDVEHWLTLLRDGTEEERQRARTELGLLLEARGLHDDAFEAYARNVEAGVSDRRPYERLAALARGRGDAPTEARALRALADLLAPPADDVLETEESRADPIPADPPQPTSTLDSLAPGGHAPQSIAPARSVAPAKAEVLPGHRRLRIVLTALMLPVLVILAGVLVMQPGRPLDAPSALTPRSPTALAVSTVPTAVELRLIADAPAVVPSPTATPPPTPSPVPTLTPIPARCADAELLFPETHNSEEAVRAAYRDFLARQGVTLNPGTALFGGLGEAYASRHAEIVAGWIAVTLQRERRSLPAFSLAEYVASDVIVATGPGEYQLRATISPQGWSEIRAWPTTTCEGAFMRNPGNARWVELMEASVGDITWALPTAQPAR